MHANDDFDDDKGCQLIIEHSEKEKISSMFPPSHILLKSNNPEMKFTHTVLVSRRKAPIGQGVKRSLP